MSEQHLPIHPYAELFPPMSLAEFERLCDDIQQHGQDDIVVLDGRSWTGAVAITPAWPEGRRRGFDPMRGNAARRWRSWSPATCTAAI